MSRLAKFLVFKIDQIKNSEDGITSIEYGMIAIVLAVALVYALYGQSGVVLTLTAKFDALTRMVNQVVLGL